MQKAKELIAQLKLLEAELTALEKEAASVQRKAFTSLNATTIEIEDLKKQHVKLTKEIKAKKQAVKKRRENLKWMR